MLSRIEETYVDANVCRHLYERRSWKSDGLSYSEMRCPLCREQVPLSEICRCALCSRTRCATCVLIEAVDDEPTVIEASTKRR